MTTRRWLQVDDWLVRHRQQLSEASLQQHLAQVDERIGGQQVREPARILYNQARRLGTEERDG